METSKENQRLLDEIIKVLDGDAGIPLYKRKDTISKIRMVLVNISNDTMAIRIMVAISLGLNIVLIILLLGHILN